MQQKFRAFSLLELLVVLSIIGILAGICLPSYSHHFVNARRKAAAATLIDLSGRLEELHTIEGGYQTAATQLNPAMLNSDKYYQFIIQHANDSQFKLNAIPRSSQNDPDCGTLSIDEMGQKSISGVGNVQQCWF